MGVGPWGAERSLEEADLPSCNAPVGHLSLIFIPLLRYLLCFLFKYVHAQVRSSPLTVCASVSASDNIITVNNR